MQKTGLLIITVAAFCAFDTSAQSLESQNPIQASTAANYQHLIWDRSSALASAQAIDTREITNQLSTSVVIGDGKLTVAQLLAIGERNDWPLPARELAIYEFTRWLATQPRQAVDPAIMDFLTAYQPQVMVGGEDHQGERLPLFNIRGAAAGIENRWLRLDSALQASEVISNNPSDFLVMFTSANNQVVRNGYLDALRQADITNIQAVGASALAQLPGAPELSAVVAIVAQSGAHQDDTVMALLMNGQGSQMTVAMRALAEQLKRAELATMLQFAIESAPTQNAALAIASWWPVLNADSNSQQLLLNTLADPALGSAAALALAHQPNLQTIYQLQQLANGDSLTSRRAQLSLDVNRQALVREQSQ